MLNRGKFCRWTGIAVVMGLALVVVMNAASADEKLTPTREAVNAKTLQHKVMCGYQGWFRCPGDGTNDGWLHWSRNNKKLTPESVTFEMWPDLSEFSADEKFLVPGFSHPDNQPAYLFSAAHSKTVERHFRWMEQYGIDGAFVQRFLVNGNRPSFDKVLDNARASATTTGRAYAVCYDLTGTPKEKLYDQLVADWKRLVDEKKVTQDDRYLHHNGKPVVMVWAFSTIVSTRLSVTASLIFSRVMRDIGYSRGRMSMVLAENKRRGVGQGVSSFRYN